MERRDRDARRLPRGAGTEFGFQPSPVKITAARSTMNSNAPRTRTVGSTRNSGWSPDARPRAFRSLIRGRFRETGRPTRARTHLLPGSLLAGRTSHRDRHACGNPLRVVVQADLHRLPGEAVPGKWSGVDQQRAVRHYSQSPGRGFCEPTSRNAAGAVGRPLQAGDPPRE